MDRHVNVEHLYTDADVVSLQCDQSFELKQGQVIFVPPFRLDADSTAKVGDKERELAKNLLAIRTIEMVVFQDSSIQLIKPRAFVWPREDIKQAFCAAFDKNIHFDRVKEVR